MHILRGYVEEPIQGDFRDENAPAYPDTGNLTTGDCLIGKRSGDAKRFCSLFDRESESLDGLVWIGVFGAPALDVKVEPRCNIFSVSKSVRVLLPPVLVDHRDRADRYLERKLWNLVIVGHGTSLPLACCPRLLLCRAEHVAHDCCCCTVAILYEVTVNPESERGVSVSKATSNGTDVHPRSYELRSREVAQVMQSDSLCSDGITNPDEKRSDIVGSEWCRAVNERGENEGIRKKRCSDSLRPADDFILVFLKEGNADGIERNLPGVVRLRRLLGDSTGDDNHGTGHLNGVRTTLLGAFQ